MEGKKDDAKAIKTEVKTTIDDVTKQPTADKDSTMDSDKENEKSDSTSAANQDDTQNLSNDGWVTVDPNDRYKHQEEVDWIEEEEGRLASLFGGDFIKIVLIDGLHEYYCEICDTARVNTKKILEQHCRGSKHIRKKQEWEEKQKQGGSGKKFAEWRTWSQTRKTSGFGIQNMDEDMPDMEPNFGMNRPDGPNFGPHGGPNFGQHGPPPPHFGPHGPSGPNFRPRGPNFDLNRPAGPQGPNFGPRGPNFDMNAPPRPNGPNFNMDGPPGPNGPNFNMNRPPGPNGPNFGPRGPNFDMIRPPGPNGPNFNMNGPPGPNGPSFAPRGPNFDMNRPPGPNGPNFNMNGPPGPSGPGFGPRGPNFDMNRPPGPNGPNPDMNRPPGPNCQNPDMNRPPGPNGPNPDMNRPPGPNGPNPDMNRPPGPNCQNPDMNRPPGPNGQNPDLNRPPGPNGPNSDVNRPPGPNGPNFGPYEPKFDLNWPPKPQGPNINMNKTSGFDYSNIDMNRPPGPNFGENKPDGSSSDIKMNAPGTDMNIPKVDGPNIGKSRPADPAFDVNKPQGLGGGRLLEYSANSSRDPRSGFDIKRLSEHKIGINKTDGSKLEMKKSDDSNFGRPDSFNYEKNKLEGSNIATNKSGKHKAVNRTGGTSFTPEESPNKNIGSNYDQNRLERTDFTTNKSDQHKTVSRTAGTRFRSEERSNFSGHKSKDKENLESPNKRLNVDTNKSRERSSERTAFDMGRYKQTHETPAQATTHSRGEQGDSNKPVQQTHLSNGHKKQDSTPATPSPRKENIADSGSGILLRKLAGCRIHDDSDAQLALNVVSSLVKSLKQYFTKKGTKKLKLLLMQAELNINTVKAIKAMSSKITSESSSSRSASDSKLEDDLDPATVAAAITTTNSNEEMQFDPTVAPPKPIKPQTPTNPFMAKISTNTHSTEYNEPMSINKSERPPAVPQQSLALPSFSYPFAPPADRHHPASGQFSQVSSVNSGPTGVPSGPPPRIATGPPIGITTGLPPTGIVTGTQPTGIPTGPPPTGMVTGTPPTGIAIAPPPRDATGPPSGIATAPPPSNNATFPPAMRPTTQPNNTHYPQVMGLPPSANTGFTPHTSGQIPAAPPPPSFSNHFSQTMGPPPRGAAPFSTPAPSVTNNNSPYSAYQYPMHSNNSSPAPFHQPPGMAPPPVRHPPPSMHPSTSMPPVHAPTSVPYSGYFTAPN